MFAGVLQLWMVFTSAAAIASAQNGLPMNIGGSDEADPLPPPSSGAPPTRNVVPSDWNLWPKRGGVPQVTYSYGDYTIDQDAITRAIRHFEENTCLTFKMASWFDYLSPHLVFRSSYDECYSYVGRQPLLLFGQTVAMTKACTGNPISVAHFIAHALGLQHVQSRSDRDAYVDVVYENIKVDKVQNFRIDVTRNFGVPYDYYSVLHYGPLTHSCNGNTTLFAKDPFAQGLMVAIRTGLSFMDALTLNRAYGCVDHWLAQCRRRVDACQNFGYLGKRCVCVCPAGTYGDYCQNMTEPYTQALMSALLPLNEAVTAPGAIKTEEYPAPYEPTSIFTKIVSAPACQNVSLTFDDFDLAERCSNGWCCREGLEVRTDPASKTSQWYCGSELGSSSTFISKSDTIVLFYMKGVIEGNTKRGFSARVTFVPATDWMQQCDI